MNNLIISANEQGTPEWFVDRLGKATGSNASAVIAQGRTKGSEATTRRNYRFQLSLQRITKKISEENFTNKHIERGNELEKFARMAYEIQSGNMIEEAGFCYQDGKQYGCSVDGFVDNRKGIIEIKCPIPAIHYEYIEENRVPPNYYAQVIHNILTTGAEYCDFISYNEDMPEKLKLFVFRFVPTKDELAAYEKALDQFLTEVDLLEQQILEKAK